MSRRWTVEDYERYTGQKLTPQAQEPSTGSRQRKYRNIPTVVDGLRFHSRREAQRYQELRLMEQAGVITALVADKKALRYPLMSNGQKIGSYTPDFVYYENGHLTVEDVKSKATKTTAYRLRKRLMKILYGIEIIEV